MFYFYFSLALLSSPLILLTLSSLCLPFNRLFHPLSLTRPPEVYLHAMVRDKEGRKMSKSLGNVIDPLEVRIAGKWGANQ